MKLKELCELYDVEYNRKNPKRSLNKLKQSYVIEETAPYDYNVIRKLTKEEQITGKKLTQCKKLLENTIYVQLSLSENNCIRKDMKGFLELFNIVNSKYRYFSYENMTEEKYRLLEGFVDPKFENVTLYDYVCDVNPVLYRMVKDIFKKMKNEMLIFVKEHLMFAKKYKIPDEQGNVVEFIRVAEANNDQVEEYLKLFRHYSEEFQVQNIEFINNKIKRKIKNKVCRDLGITYAYTEYELILNREGLKDEVDYNEDLKELKDSLNKNIIHKLNTSTQGHLKEYELEDKKKCSDFLIRI